MTPSVLFRRRLLGWSLLALLAAVGGFWLLRLDLSTHISTDVLDLVPTGEGSPELTLVRSLASDAESRTMLIALDGPHGAPATAEAARLFADTLRRDPSFDQVAALGDTTGRDALGQVLFAHRLTLLFPRWLAERQRDHAAAGAPPGEFASWLATDAARRLSTSLATPEALAFQDLVPSDPLLLLPGVVGRLAGGLALVQPAGNATTDSLVWARLAASPLSEAGQAPAFAAIEKAAAEVGKVHTGLTVRYTGVNRFAAASRALIEREVTWLNTASLIAVLLVAFSFIRSVHRGLHLVPVVLLSILGAWVFVMLLCDRVHVLVFIIGSLLTGVAIDYGFYLYMQPPDTPGEDYWHKVRRLAKPLLASCFTTVAGFALLLFSELPFIRQLGVFVGSGLLCALVAAVIYFSTVRDAFLESRSFRGAQALPEGVRRGLRRGLAVLGLAALPGLAWLEWRDDIRDLEIPSPGVKQNDAEIRARFGDESSRTVYLTTGPTLAAARTALAEFEAWLPRAGTPATQSVGLGVVVPTPAEVARARTFVREHPGFPDALRTALAAEGFESDAFAPFFAAYQAHQREDNDRAWESAVGELHAKMTGPIGLLFHAGPPLTWFVTLVSHAPTTAPPETAATISTGQLQTLNRVFARYRESALWLSLAGLAVVGLGVFLTYGLADGVRIFAIPGGACLGVFGVYGWIGHPLNLFHLLGAFLGVCLTHNYSIFSATSAYRHEPTPVSVRISALTTAASFGVLALSGIPVVRALGQTVAAMVALALLMIELEHLGGLRRSR